MVLLDELLKNVSYERIINEKVLQVSGLSADSKHVFDGDLFFCFKGAESDGHDYATDALKQGAVAIICERELPIETCQIIVKDARKSMSEFARVFYGNPAEKMKIIAITGTNGKTTTSHMLASIFNEAGIPCALVGTLGVFYGNKEIEPSLTTPDPIFLHKIFADMVDCGIEIVVMEVSAHAIFYDKIDGIKFEYCIFTNCTQDHLDFFKDMQTYSQVKKSLFSKERCKTAIVNTDDEICASLYESGVFGFGLENPADVFAVNIRESVTGSSFVLNLYDDLYDINLSLTGRHNVYNAMAAASCAKLLGVETCVIAKGLENLKRVSGRLELVAHFNGADIFVDFAHTPDGLEKSLSSLKSHCKNRLICVFGCGGNREKQKRQLMGEISGKLADFTVITSDNPRYEDPLDIIMQIEKGMRKVNKNYVIVVDREKAISYSINILKKGDILIIAGKGGENYQEIMGVKHFYNDVSVIKEVINEQLGEKSEN